MPCTINSSPARASRVYRQATGNMVDAGESESARGFDCCWKKKRPLAEKRYRGTETLFRAGPEIMHNWPGDGGVETRTENETRTRAETCL
jgi:hypothetical protein